MRKGQVLAFSVGGLLVVSLSFVITLWLTEPEVPPAEKLKLLAASRIVDRSTLSAAAKTSGLLNSSYVKGKVDALTRLDAAHVSIAGWATETVRYTFKGASVTVMVFSGGRNILSVQTHGERPDVTSALNLSDDAARNVAFVGRMECISGQELIVVAATLSGTYAAFDTAKCP